MLQNKFWELKLVCKSKNKNEGYYLKQTSMQDAQKEKNVEKKLPKDGGNVKKLSTMKNA